MGGAGNVVWPFQGTRQEEQEERIGLIAEEQEELRGNRLRDEAEELLTQMGMSKEQQQPPAASAVIPTGALIPHAPSYVSYTRSLRPHILVA